VSQNTETIVAPATPTGHSALAVVRASGPSCKKIAHELFQLDNLEPRKMHLARWSDAAGAIDQLLVLFFPAPHSFTGEDLLEIFPHGNPLLVQKLLKEIAAFDRCRLAEPGEFTRRAYENGKIDLTQAEAIDAKIHAHTSEALQLAQRLSEGKLSKAVELLKKQMEELSAQVELEMDFAEEEGDPEMEQWPASIEAMRDKISVLLQGWERTQRVLRLPKVVLFGPPNAGKSSLANALLGEERHLVSEQPGTTRDWIESHLVLPTGEIILCDTAGLGRAQDELDSAAQKRTTRLLKNADIAVWVEDGRLPATHPTPPSKETPLIRVRTRQALPPFFPEEGAFSVDCKTEEGISEFRRALQREILNRPPLSENALIATERQADTLRRTDQLLEEAVALLQKRERTTPELVAHLLRQSRDTLVTITGEISDQELLEKIFSRFCIGK